VLKDTVYGNLLKLALELITREEGRSAASVFQGNHNAVETFVEIEANLRLYETSYCIYKESEQNLDELKKAYGSLSYLDTLAIKYVYSAPMNFLRKTYASKANATVTLELELKLDRLLRRQPDSLQAFQDYCAEVQRFFATRDINTAKLLLETRSDDINERLTRVNSALAELDDAADELWVAGALADTNGA
jgi:hypothetical protein